MSLHLNLWKDVVLRLLSAKLMTLDLAHGQLCKSLSIQLYLSFLTSLYIIQRINFSKCIECIYFCWHVVCLLKSCLEMRICAFKRRKGSWEPSLAILKYFLPQVTEAKRESMLSGTLRYAVPPGGIFLQENYPQPELPLSWIITWGIFSALNITSLSVDSLLCQAI